MNPVGKALWYIDRHFADEVTLDVIAAISGVSRYYLSHAFGEATGYPVMGSKSGTGTIEIWIPLRA
jgi:AraC family transcriptional regulator